jgi:signal transduction histidine kinase
MSSINQRLFLVSLVLVLVAMMGWRLMFDLDALGVIARGVQVRFAWSIAAVLAVVVLLMVYLNRTISRPVRQLIAEIDRALESGAPARIEVRGNDELATLGARFNMLQDRLARRMRELEQFAGTVCHEIRTPLTSILSATEIMDAEKEPFVKIIRSEAERIRELSTTILKYAGSVKAGAAPQRVRCELGALLQDLVAVPAYAERVRVVGESRLELVTDPELLTQALAIILDNSLRYSPADTLVTVQLGDGEILIRNESPHIPEVYLERVFERFFSLPVAGRAKGTGIGLALCRDLVEALGGGVEAMNLAPSGVLFCVSLPRV